MVIMLGLMMASAPVTGLAQQKRTTTTQKNKSTSQSKTPAKKTTSSAKKTTTPAKKTTSTSGKTSAKTTTRKVSTQSKSRAEYERQQKALQQQIKETERMLSNNDQSVRAQNRDIKLREEEMRRRKDLIGAMKQEILAYHKEEDSLQTVIEQLDRSCQEKQEKYARAVRHMFRSRHGNDAILFVLAASDLQDSFRRLNYLREYSQWRHQEAEDLKAEREYVQQAREALVQMRQEREQLMAGVTREQKTLETKQQEQQKAVADLQKRSKELKAELERDKKEQQEIQRRIQQIIDEERRKAEEAERKAKEREAAARKKNSGNGSGTTSSSGSQTGKTKPSGTITNDNNWTRLTGNFRQNKGKLPYPLDVNFAFLEHYSPATTGNVGITLSAAVGAHACSIFEGTVTRVSRTAEEYTVIVRHGDYMSVYSNLASVSVKEGQTVQIRQRLGQLKTDVSGRHSELLFWIYGKANAENPEAWLRR